MERDEYDIVIVGCGPAGLSAAIFCGRTGMKTVVVGVPEKRQLVLAPHIENYFGFPDGIDGAMLLNRGVMHAAKFGVPVIKEEVVTATAVTQGEHPVFVVKTNIGQAVTAHALIIATGVPIRSSGIDREEALVGKGVHYCVWCDGPMYKNKRLAVIGSGDHAAEDAIEALSYSKDVTIISNAPACTFSDAFQHELARWNIKTVCARVKAFRGDTKLESLVFEDSTEGRYDAVFMACGTAGALDFAANLGLEITENTIVVDENNMTSMEGVFAAGNCEGRCRQIAKNVGDGCNAAVSAIRYLRPRKLFLDYGHKELSAGEMSMQQPQEKQVTATSVPPSRVPLSLPLNRKVRVGWFSFSCCEDSTIVFTELLNDYYDKLKDVVDICHARVLRRNNELKDLDIAFVEGAISNEKAADELREIRRNTKRLVAVGACAVTGMPSGQRNLFDEGRLREIEPIVRTFDYRKKVVPVHDVVYVDDNVPGCPMLEAVFLSVLNKQLKEFGINAQL